MTAETEELHAVYHEPRPTVPAGGLAGLLAGPPVLKVLFMAPPARVDAEMLPHWAAALAGRGAAPTRAVPNMLELVPTGASKWGGLEAVLADLGIPHSDLVAVGDGGNDLEMIVGAGVGVAMGNAVPEVLAAADAVVAGHGDGGVAEAIERFVL